jgi:hypothetical protein
MNFRPIFLVFDASSVLPFTFTSISDETARLIIYRAFIQGELKGPLISSVQNSNLICTHILRIPLLVKSRLRNRPGGGPFTLICGTLTNCG